jgi:hypothetical protein
MADWIFSRTEAFLSMIWSNAVSFWVGMGRRLIDEGEKELITIAEEDFDFLFNELADAMKKDWDIYIAGGSSEVVDEGSAVEDVVTATFKKTLNRILEIKTPT